MGLFGFLANVVVNYVSQRSGASENSSGGNGVNNAEKPADTDLFGDSGVVQSSEGLFDEPEDDNSVQDNESPENPAEDFTNGFLGFLYNGFSKLFGFAEKIGNEVLASADSKTDFTTKDENGNITGGYMLESTDDGTTVKTSYNADGSANESLNEQWTDRFENYTKVWTAPSGETSTLKASGEVTDNGDGTFNVPVKKTGLGASDETFILVLDKNGNEVNRFDGAGNRYDSSGSLARKSFTTKDDNGKITGGYELDLTGGKTNKIRYDADGTVNNRISESWINEYNDYKKEWNGPNGEKTVLESTGVKDNGDGTFNVTVKRTDARYPDKIFTMVMDANGEEIDRFDEEGNHYNSIGELVKEAEKPAEAPAAQTAASAAGTQPAPAPAEAQPAPAATTPAAETKPAETSAPAAKPEASAKPAAEAAVDAAPKVEPLKKVGLYFQKIETKNGVTTTYMYYDEAGTKLHSKTEKLGSGAVNESYYSESNQKYPSRIKMTSKDGSVTDTTYDNQGRPVKSTETKNGETTTYEYAYRGKQTTVTKRTTTEPGATVTVKEGAVTVSETKLNASGQPLTKVNYASDGKTVASNTTYTYNKQGNLDKEVLTTMNDKCGAHNCKSYLTTTYQYDKNGKLTGSMRQMNYGVDQLISAGREWTEICDASGKVIKWSASTTWVGQTFGPWNKPSGIHQ